MSSFSLFGNAAKSKLPPDLMAIDFGATGMKVLRVRRTKDHLQLLGADILPAVDLLQDLPDDAGRQIAFPVNLLTDYALIAFTHPAGKVRYLNLASTSELEKQLSDSMGLSAEHRLVYSTVAPVRGKTEARILAVSMPEADAQRLLTRFSIGKPAPLALEFSELAAISGILSDPEAALGSKSVGVIACGATTSLVAFFTDGALAFLRRFEFGGEAVVQEVQQRTGLDRKMSLAVMADGSIDISQPVTLATAAFMRQVCISRDFAERQENVHIDRVLLTGGMALVKAWQQVLEATLAVKVDVWNPFGSFQLAAGAYPAALDGQQARFGAAAGAVLGLYSTEAS